MCVTEDAHKAAIDRGAESLCSDAIAKRDKFQGEAVKERNARVFCEGRLKQALEPQPAPPPAFRSPWVLRVALDTLIPVGGVALGYALAKGANTEIVVGVAVAELALVGVRLALEWLDDRAR